MAAWPCHQPLRMRTDNFFHQPLQMRTPAPSAEEWRGQDVDPFPVSDNCKSIVNCLALLVWCKFGGEWRVGPRATFRKPTDLSFFS